MGLVNIFKSSKLDKWKSIDKKTQNSLDDFKEYLDRLLAKIEFFQEIFLKIVDFDNMHFFEKIDIKYLRGGMGHNASPKLYEKYFYVTKKRLKKLDGLIIKEFKYQNRENLELIFIHRKLLDINSDQEDSPLLIGDIDDFENKLKKLEKILGNQLMLVQNTKDEFKRFVGNEQRWETDYNAANTKSERFYSDVIKNKNQIFSDWNSFLESLNKIKASIKEEIIIVTGQNPGDNISYWKVFVTDNFKQFPILSDLDNLLKKTRRIVIITKDMINLYHATENTKVLPLSESMYPNGFYFCTTNIKYASKIKSDILPNQGQGSAMNTFTLSIPKSLLVEFALHDANLGNPKDEESIEAYENAYYVPVSKFPKFNHYVSEGLIIMKN
jgi:hypothetical protein